VVAGDAGRYADLRARWVAGDTLEAHHMPQVAAHFTSKVDGGALMMTVAEHAQTRTYRGKGRVVARNEANIPFRVVLERDIRDVRKISGRRYNPGLLDVLNYYRTRFPQLMRKNKSPER
jgi:hypothetical protein